MSKEQVGALIPGTKSVHAHRWLLAYQVIWPSQENLGGQVPVSPIAKGARYQKGLKGKFLHTNGHIPIA